MRASARPARRAGQIVRLPLFRPSWADEGGPRRALNRSGGLLGPAGQRLTFEARIAEILQRYPADHPVHRAISRSRSRLAAAVDRTARQLAGAA
jgi:hypothetical protein